MTGTTRTLTRLSRAVPVRSSFARTSSYAPRHTIRHIPRRGYADLPPDSSGARLGSVPFLFGVCGATAAAVGGFYFYNHNRAPAYTPPSTEGKGNEEKVTNSAVDKAADKTSSATKTAYDQKAYQEVYDAVAHRLHEVDDYDDGSYGPVILRLGWHASGTYDAETKTGGSNGSTMRFAPEGDHGANAGLKAARDFLEPIKTQFPWITYSDLWILSAVCSIQELGGPTIPWRPGRSDRDESWCTPDGRLPDGAKEQKHLRAIFGRMGFNDQETVALSGAHALGRCHTDRSGFEGPWTFSPTVVTNDYYKLLMEEQWGYKKWNGPKQFEDVSTKSLMMLPTDMALVQDKGFKAWVEAYANDNDKFFDDFSKVLCKLFELGVPFETGEESRMRFKATE